MNYIVYEHFIKQSKTIQREFILWWKPTIGDLYLDIDAHGKDKLCCILTDEKKECIEIDKKYNYYIPLLTETQLRHYIEEKTNAKVEWNYNLERGWIAEVIKDTDVCGKWIHTEVKEDMLLAWWELACKIASSLIKGE